MISIWLGKLHVGRPEGSAHMQRVSFRCGQLAYPAGAVQMSESPGAGGTNRGRRDDSGSLQTKRSWFFASLSLASIQFTLFAQHSIFSSEGYQTPLCLFPRQPFCKGDSYGSKYESEVNDGHHRHDLYVFQRQVATQVSL